jgi:hypothetical protein
VFLHLFVGECLPFPQNKYKHTGMASIPLRITKYMSAIRQLYEGKKPSTPYTILYRAQPSAQEPCQIPNGTWGNKHMKQIGCKNYFMVLYYKVINFLYNEYHQGQKFSQKIQKSRF